MILEVVVISLVLGWRVLGKEGSHIVIGRINQEERLPRALAEDQLVAHVLLRGDRAASLDHHAVLPTDRALAVLLQPMEPRSISFEPPAARTSSRKDGQFHTSRYVTCAWTVLLLCLLRRPRVHVAGCLKDPCPFKGATMVMPIVRPTATMVMPSMRILVIMGMSIMRVLVIMGMSIMRVLVVMGMLSLICDNISRE